MFSLNTWLYSLAQACEENNQSLIPALILVNQYAESQFSEEEAIQRFKSLCPPGLRPVTTSEATILVKAISKHCKQPITWTKYVIKSMPFPSTAHFEYIRFGRRVDARCAWARYGNKKHALAFRWVEKRPNRITAAMFADDRPADEDVSQCVQFLIGFKDGRFEPSNYIDPFIYVPKVAKTPRSNANAARHNITRFVSWLERAESPRLRQDIRRVWDRSRLQFQIAVREMLTDRYIDQWLEETDHRPGNASRAIE